MLLLALGRATLFQAASHTREGVGRGRRQGQPKGQGRRRWLRAKGGSNGWQLQGHNPTSLQQRQALPQPGHSLRERLRWNTKQRLLGSEKTVIRQCDEVEEWKRSLGWPGGKKPHDGKRQRQRRGPKRRQGHKH